MSVAACVAASVATAITLHAAPSRPDAALAVVPLLAWGVLALWGAWRLRDTPAAPLGIAAVAIAVRAPLVGTPWLLSDDAWRYLWEGAALNAGLDPFAHAPSTLPGLDDALLAKVNHPDMASIYPPVALWWFRLLAVPRSAWVSQVGAGAADVGTAVAILAWRRERGRSAWPAWLYALHPLAAIESAGNAHLEAVALALCTTGLVAWCRRRDHLAAALVVAAAGVKVFPVLLIPRLVRGRAWWTAGAATVGLLLLAWPVWGAGGALFGSARVYASTWSFDPLIYPLLLPIAGAATRPILVATGAAMVLGAWRYASGPVGVWMAAGTAFVVLSPTVHPWYVLWAVVPALLAGTWGWATAAVAFQASYLVLLGFDPATGSWAEQPWLPWVTWVPALAALAAEWAVSAAPASPAPGPDPS